MVDFEFQGKSVTLPCIVQKASSLTSFFLVPSAAARRLLPDDALSVIEFLPGRTLLSLGCIDYEENDLGDYEEVMFALFVRESAKGKAPGFARAWLDFARSRLGTYVHRLPVNQTFTCEAGRALWGFPKTVEEIRFDVRDGRVSWSLAMDGREVLSLLGKTGGKSKVPEMNARTYSYIDGRLHVTPFVSSASEVGFELGGAAPELGEHPVADELRSLGLPKRPLMTVWAGRMRARFEAARPVG